MRGWTLLTTLGFAWLLSSHIGAASDAPSPVITSPNDGAVFPRDFAPPLFRWNDTSPATRWTVRVDVGDKTAAITGESEKPEWRPSVVQWEAVKAKSLGRSARFTVAAIPGAGSDDSAGRASAQVSFQTSPDPVGASIFYREVPLPVAFAMDNKRLITWKVGDVSSGQSPRTVLAGMGTCGNCHSFSRDGKTLGMDIDFGSDKSTYAIADVGQKVAIGPEQLIAWNDFRREDGEPTLGFLSALSPSGDFVVSTVKETIALHFLPDPFMSQIFFPVRGILAVYDRKARKFGPLRGADDPGFVQTNSTFSPDGIRLVFARAKAPDLPRQGTAIDPERQLAIAADFEEGRKKIQFDLYRLPFNEGRGGAPEPIPGAASNGKSNYFPRFSPDGKWIVFCQADSMMLNRPDSALYILPAAGGTPRRMRCNAPGRMNSWHSFSPNGRWLVYASKAAGPLTQMWLTHIDSNGNDSPPVVLDGFIAPDRAANLPEFVSLAPGQLEAVVVADGIKSPDSNLPSRPR